MSKKTSEAWQHFVALDDGKNAKCNHCSRTVVIANGSTGNLFRHMKLRHPSLSVRKHPRSKPHLFSNKINATIPIENKICSERKEIVPATIVEVLPTTATDLTKISNSPENVINATILPDISNVSENFNQQPVSYYLIQPLDENKQQELDKQLLKIIVKNLIPFSIVESQEFIRLAQMLNPSYTVPSRKKLSNDVLVCMYQSTVTELKCTLKDIDEVALTADSWKSVNDEHFIAFSIHYLNKNLELKSNYLQCFSSLQKFSTIDIALFIEELASNWNLCGKILAVVTDGSKEIIKAVHNCNLNHIPCFAQTLNQIVEAGFSEINPLILKIRNVVQYFKKNSMALNKLYSIQNEMGLSDSKLVSDIPSRWDTTFNMFIVFLKNKVPLLSSIERLQLNFLKLSSADFHYLESTVKVLAIFNSVKIAMCSENNLSLSKILHLICFMSKHLQNVLEETKLPSDIVKMGNLMRDKLKQFEELKKSELIFQAVILDPRFKKRGFPNDSFKEACIALQHDVAVAREDIAREKNESPILSKPEQCSTKSDSEYFIDMWSEFESKDPSPVLDHTAAASVEVDAFLNDLYMPIEGNPLSYWANISNQNKFPALFELAKRVLCIPATSVPCQQLYSKSGHVFFKKRKYLPSVKVDKLLFLYHNL